MCRCKSTGLPGKLQMLLVHQNAGGRCFAHREHIGCTVDYVAGRNRYMGYLFSLGIYSFKGVKVGLDCANGANWNIAKSVFDALGADTYVVNNKPNGTNINNNAGSTHIEGLQKFVVENGLDVGFAFDGDADRCLCVDEKGNVITGDHILYIYGCYMKERGKLLTNAVVTTVMSNFGLYKAFDKQGIGYAKTAVGDKYVYEYMTKNGCRTVGERLLDTLLIQSARCPAQSGVELFKVIRLNLLNLFLAEIRRDKILDHGYRVGVGFGCPLVLAGLDGKPLVQHFRYRHCIGYEEGAVQQFLLHRDLALLRFGLGLEGFPALAGLASVILVVVSDGIRVATFHTSYA